MAFVEHSTLITILLVLVALLLASVFRLRRKYRILISKLFEAHETLTSAEEEFQSLEEKYQKSMKFQKDIDDAELTTRLQQPRLSAQYSRDVIEAPERYQYVRSLAESGMSAGDIAEVLNISPQEAEQLVKLSKLANTST